MKNSGVSVVEFESTGYPKKRTRLEAELRKILSRPPRRESVARIRTLLARAKKK